MAMLYRPSHLHVKVRAPGRPTLTTQLYFDGDPFNEVDPFLHPSLIMKPRTLADGSLDAAFDFVLA